MSVDSRAFVVKLIEEIFNRKRMGLVETMYAPNCRGYSPDGWIPNRNGFVALIDRYIMAFPNFRINIQRTIAEDDWVAVHYLFVGTNTGPLLGLPATGNVLRIPGCIVSRIAHNQIVEQHLMWDNLSARRQLQSAQVLAA